MRIPMLTLAVLLAAGCTAPDTDSDTAAPSAATPATNPPPAAAPGDSVTAAPEPADATVPTRFQGDYAANAAACNSPAHESHLAVTATRIEFHESSGDITSVDASGHDIDITARVTGEGETRDVGYSFMLSDDGGTLTDTVNRMQRVRCPAG